MNQSARAKRRQLRENVATGIVGIPDHADLADPTFRDRQVDNAIFHGLLRSDDDNGGGNPMPDRIFPTLVAPSRCRRGLPRAFKTQMLRCGEEGSNTRVRGGLAVSQLTDIVLVFWPVPASAGCTRPDWEAVQAFRRPFDSSGTGCSTAVASSTMGQSDRCRARGPGRSPTPPSHVLSLSSTCPLWRMLRPLSELAFGLRRRSPVFLFIDATRSILPIFCRSRVEHPAIRGTMYRAKVTGGLSTHSRLVNSS